jgi:hypothetical protein
MNLLREITIVERFGISTEFHSVEFLHIGLSRQRLRGASGLDGRAGGWRDTAVPAIVKRGRTLARG